MKYSPRAQGTASQLVINNSLSAIQDQIHSIAMKKEPGLRVTLAFVNLCK
jgi:hypothetical protein